MPQASPTTRSTVIPCLRYRNARAAMQWLCQVIGFQEGLVVPGENGEIAHAQLTLGGGMIMLASVPKTETEFGRLLKQPDQIGGFETQSPYVIVPDADAVYERAKDAQAPIVIEIKNEDYGGRGFSCKDPEGRVWNIGTYDPWA